MNKKLLGLALISPLLIAGCTATNHFGVPDRAAHVPQWITDDEAIIIRAEASPGARACPDQIAKARELAAKAMELYWACRDAEASSLLAEASRLAAEAEACSGPVTRRTELGADALFAFNQATLTRQGEATLNTLAQDLQKRLGQLDSSRRSHRPARVRRLQPAALRAARPQCRPVSGQPGRAGRSHPRRRPWRDAAQGHAGRMRCRRREDPSSTHPVLSAEPARRCDG